MVIIFYSSQPVSLHFFPLNSKYIFILDVSGPLGLPGRPPVEAERGVALHRRRGQWGRGGVVAGVESKVLGNGRCIGF